MPVKTYTHNSGSGSRAGPKIVLVVQYDCNEGADDLGLDVSATVGGGGWEFVITSDYDLVDTLIESRRHVPCEKEGCRNAKKWEFEVAFVMELQVGFGVGEFAWHPDFLHKHWTEIVNFETPCICCD